MIGAILGGVSIASSLYGGVSGYKAGKKSAKQAKKIGRLQSKEFLRRADEEQRLGIEQQKLMTDQQARRKELIKSMYKNSGLLLTGTPKQALSEQSDADAYNLEEASLSTESRVESLTQSARLAKLGASNAASAYEQQGQNAMLGGIFGAIGGATKVAGSLKNWMGGGKNTYAQDKANMMELTRPSTNSWLDDFLKDWK